jgi:WD40 repeat protein
VNLTQRFRSYPHRIQILLTLLSVCIMVLLWSSCGIGVHSDVPPFVKANVEVENPGGVIRSIVFTPKGDWFATGDDGGIISFWYAASRTRVDAINPHRGKVIALAIDPDGTLIASAFEDSSILFWDASHKTIVRTLQTSGPKVTDVALSRDGQLLASSSADNSVTLWEVSSGKQLRVLHGHTAQINAVAFAPTSSLLASAGNDATIRIWNAETGDLVKSLPGLSLPILSLRFSPDGRLLAAGADSLTYDPSSKVPLLTVRSTLNWKEVHNFSKEVYRRVQCVAFSPDSTRLAANYSGALGIWNTSKWQVIEATTSRWEGLTALAFSPDGRLLVSATGEGHIRFLP